MKKRVWEKLKVLLLTCIMVAGVFTGTRVDAMGSITTSQSDLEGSLQVLCYNVAGLPEILSSSDPETNMPLISPKLNAYDLVSVQEDFAYHSDLISELTLAYQTEFSGNVPSGDGLDLFSTYDLQDEGRETWEESCGFITNGADEMTPKGILYSSMELAPGYYVDVYDLHADAGLDSGSLEARQANIIQLEELINERSQGKAVIVMGDFNGRYTRTDDNIEEVVDGCGLTDAWVEIKRDGVRPTKDDNSLQDTDNLNSGDYEVVDKILYRSGGNVDLSATAYELYEDEFTRDDGEQLSDHYPITATLSYTLNPSTLYDEIYGGEGGEGFTTGAMSSAHIDQVTIDYGERIDCMTITYDDGSVKTFGGDGGTNQVSLDIDADDYITSIELGKSQKSSSSTYRISYIKLTTNDQNVLEALGTEENLETFDVPEGYFLSGFYGREGDELDALGAIYSEIE